MPQIKGWNLTCSENQAKIFLSEDQSRFIVRLKGREIAKGLIGETVLVSTAPSHLVRIDAENKKINVESDFLEE